MHILTTLLFSLHYNISTSLWHTHCTATYSLHYWTSLHFTFNSLNQSTRPYDNLIFSFQLTSLHLYIVHFTALVITFLTLCLKLYVLLVRAPISPSVSWFQSVMVLFTKEYLPTSVLCCNNQGNIAKYKSARSYLLRIGNLKVRRNDDTVI